MIWAIELSSAEARVSSDAPLAVSVEFFSDDGEASPGEPARRFNRGSLEAFSADSPEEFILSSAFALGAGSGRLRW